MFGISFAEFLTITLIAIFLIKPQDLPEIAYNLGQFYGKIKKIIQNIKNEFEKTQKDVGIDNIKQEFIAGLSKEEISQEKTVEIVDIYGKTHKIDNISQIRSDLSQKELEEELKKCNEANKNGKINP